MDEIIHDYYYKPEPIFYGDGPRYLGVELELDDGGENEFCASNYLTLQMLKKSICTSNMTVHLMMALNV